MRTRLLVCLLTLLPGLVVLGAAEHPWHRLEAALEQHGSEPEQARETIAGLVAEYPEFHAAQYNLGCLLAGADDPAAARHFQAATASGDPQLAARAWHNLALCRYRQQQLEAAVAAADEAVAAQPEDEGYRRNRDALRTILLRRQEAARLAAEEAARALTFGEQELPPSWEGEAWEAELTAQGGTGGPYTFSLADGAELPAGLRLGGAGRLTGTPGADTAGRQQVELVVGDGETTVTGTLSWTILPEPAIVVGELPVAIVGQTYTTAVASRGFLAPRWSVAGLPDGLRASGIGDRLEIAGIPSEAGSFALQIAAVDDYHRREATATLSVEADGFAPAERQLDDATNWHAFRQRLTVRGRPAVYTWSGSASNGLSVESDGLVRGIPQQVGDHRIPVTITRQDDGETRHFDLPIHVNPPPVIEVDEAIQATVGSALQERLQVTGGTHPLVWSLADGQTGLLPPGVRFTDTGGFVGVPGLAGEYTVTVQVTDRWQAQTQAAVTISVQEPQEPQEPQDQEQQDGDQDQEQEQEQGQDQQQGQRGDQQQQGQSQQQDGGQGQQEGRQDQGDQAQSRGGEDQAGEQGDQSQQDQGGAEAGAQGDEDADGEEQAGQAADPIAGRDDEGQDGDERAGGREVGDVAADMWLENLPDSSQGRLLFQLLEGREAQEQEDRYEGDPW